MIFGAVLSLRPYQRPHPLAIFSDAPRKNIPNATAKLRRIRSVMYGNDMLLTMLPTPEPRPVNIDATLIGGVTGASVVVVVVVVASVIFTPTSTAKAATDISDVAKIELSKANPFRIIIIHCSCFKLFVPPVIFDLSVSSTENNEF